MLTMPIWTLVHGFAIAVEPETFAMAAGAFGTSKDMHFGMGLSHGTVSSAVGPGRFDAREQVAILDREAEMRRRLREMAAAR